MKVESWKLKVEKWKMKNEKWKMKVRYEVPTVHSSKILGLALAYMQEAKMSK